MRRLLFLLVPAILLVPTSVSASSWLSFQSRQIGVAIRYPANWKLIQSNSLLNKQVTLTYSSKTLYDLNVTVEPVAPGRTPEQTVSRFMAHEHRISMTAYDRIHWYRTTLAGHPAMAGVSKPSTEGGIPISNGVYIVGWRNHVYDVKIFSYHKPPLSRLNQFPAIYQQILSTLHFL